MMSEIICIIKMMISKVLFFFFFFDIVHPQYPFYVILLYWHKTNIFILGFSHIIHFISVYLIFCKHG